MSCHSSRSVSDPFLSPHQQFRMGDLVYPLKEQKKRYQSTVGVEPVHMQFSADELIQKNVVYVKIFLYDYNITNYVFFSD